MKPPSSHHVTSLPHPTGRHRHDSSERWKSPVLPDRIQNLDQRDPELIDHIRNYWIIPPQPGRINLNPATYKKNKRYDFSEQGQVQAVLEMLDDRRDGFFVECGAADGQRNSNSLYLELFMNWTGLLIEPDPNFFAELLSKNRHAYSINTCLSPTSKPLVANFTTAGISGGISDLIPNGQRKRYNMDQRTPIKVQCFPLYSILEALRVSHVDYFSLDIEGAEVDVLETFPHANVTFDVISVEKRLIDDELGTAKKEKRIIDLLSPYGYKLIKRLKFDIMLQRRSFQ
ncbi:hypothetical protein LSH36_1131g00011 [Paralvinella palmiformis]|uniref:Methyltransferase FkbM domain-containing protein n=1 Tax=Paralvinella palmiformis TaxID=53620 RepID=A0AAD9IUM4_9ANNE|nr:hypothetical protein LSH36_1131g00011 [Paralvinella palmiformis]